MKKFFIFAMLLFAFSETSFAQLRANNWRFGNKSGMDFATTPVSSVNTSVMFASEGCASISNDAGVMLFYTNGEQVWDASNNIMSGCPLAGIGGNEFAAQNALVIKRPGSTSLYYIFTNPGFASGGNFGYSVVDMSLNGGLGAVTSFNNFLMQGTSERLAAVESCDGLSHWVVTHSESGNSFLAFKVTSTGISAPVISQGGPAFAVPIGQLKFSPDRLSLAMTEVGTDLWLMNFDPNLGVVYNSLQLNTPSYGVSFSPNSNRLYCSGDTSEVYQFNVGLANTALIPNTKTNISLSTTGYAGTLQLGPNGRIYIAKYLQDSIDFIRSPNLLGFACNYREKDIDLIPNSCELGLPNFSETDVIPGRQKTIATFYHNLCNGLDTARFELNDVGTVVNYSWNFGDIASGAANTSNLAIPTHNFTTMGTYPVKLKITGTCGVDSATINVSTGLISINAANNVSVCEGKSVNLNVVATSAQSLSNIVYLWSQSAGTGTLSCTNCANPNLTTPVSATYTIQVSSGVCQVIDSIEVDIKPLPQLFVTPQDSLYCEPGASIQMVASGADFYDWTKLGGIITNVTCTSCPNPVATPIGTTSYIVEGINANGCNSFDTVNLTIVPLNSAFITAPFDLDSICLGEKFTLSGFALGAGPKIYFDFGNGTDSATTSIQNYEYLVAGLYNIFMVAYDTLGCVDSFKRTVFVDDLARPYLSVSDSMPCFGDRVFFKDSVSPLAENWSLEYGIDNIKAPGHNTNFLYPTSGIYSVILRENHLKCPDTVLTQNIFIEKTPEVDLGPDTTYCKGSSTQAILLTSLKPLGGYKKLWSTGDSVANAIFAKGPGDYFLKVTSINGCTATDSISVKNDCYLNIPNAFTPNGDGYNDFWMPNELLSSGVFYYTLKVFNRWGEVVFETKDKNSKGWDGKFGGKNQPLGTYIYRINYALNNGEVNEAAGNFSLLR
jgi:gliding motility-associated-like protein